MKYKNKYFKKLGYKNSCTEELFFGSLQKDKRNKKWEKQQKKYGGYDDRVAWSLNTFMTEQIYIWLKMYLNNADGFIDLTFYKFDIDGKILTEKEAILLAISDIEFYLLNNDKIDFNMTSEEIEKLTKQCLSKIAEAYKIIGIILPTLWY